jgi:hypothetical protein
VLSPLLQEYMGAKSAFYPGVRYLRAERTYLRGSAARHDRRWEKAASKLGSGERNRPQQVDSAVATYNRQSIEL